MVDFWKYVKTKPLDPDSLKQELEEAQKIPEQMPTYVVCVEDWRKIKARSDEKSISHFSAYLELLNEGKVRPAFTG